jgi:hypothetical protein
MRKLFLTVLVVAMYALHQDVWFWRTAQPIVLGLFPIGLFYHAMYAAAVALLMALLVRFAWPESNV